MLLVLKFVSYPEPEKVHDDQADPERMDYQETDVHETLGGWTEVEMNPTKDFQPKVKVTIHLYYNIVPERIAN